MDYISLMKRDIKMIKNNNINKINRKFEPTTYCKDCHFCYKGNPEYGLFRACMLQAKILDNQVIGCFMGYKLKEEQK